MSSEGSPSAQEPDIAGQHNGIDGTPPTQAEGVRGSQGAPDGGASSAGSVAEEVGDDGDDSDVLDAGGTQHPGASSGVRLIDRALDGVLQGRATDVTSGAVAAELCGDGMALLRFRVPPALSSRTTVTCATGVGGERRSDCSITARLLQHLVESGALSLILDLLRKRDDTAALGKSFWDQVRACVNRARAEERKINGTFATAACTALLSLMAEEPGVTWAPAQWHERDAAMGDAVSLELCAKSRGRSTDAGLQQWCKEKGFSAEDGNVEPPIAVVARVSNCYPFPLKPEHTNLASVLAGLTAAMRPADAGGNDSDHVAVDVTHQGDTLANHLLSCTMGEASAGALRDKLVSDQQVVLKRHITRATREGRILVVGGLEAHVQFDADMDVLVVKDSNTATAGSTCFEAGVGAWKAGGSLKIGTKARGQRAVARMYPSRAFYAIHQGREKVTHNMLQGAEGSRRRATNGMRVWECVRDVHCGCYLSAGVRVTGGVRASGAYVLVIAAPSSTSRRPDSPAPVNATAAPSRGASRAARGVLPAPRPGQGTVRQGATPGVIGPHEEIEDEAVPSAVVEENVIKCRHAPGVGCDCHLPEDLASGAAPLTVIPKGNELVLVPKKVHKGRWAPGIRTKTEYQGVRLRVPEDGKPWERLSVLRQVYAMRVMQAACTTDWVQTWNGGHDTDEERARLVQFGWGAGAFTGAAVHREAIEKALCIPWWDGCADVANVTRTPDGAPGLHVSVEMGSTGVDAAGTGDDKHLIVTLDGSRDDMVSIARASAAQTTIRLGTSRGTGPSAAQSWDLEFAVLQATADANAWCTIFVLPSNVNAYAKNAWSQVKRTVNLNTLPRDWHRGAAQLAHALCATGMGMDKNVVLVPSSETKQGWRLKNKSKRNSMNPNGVGAHMMALLRAPEPAEDGSGGGSSTQGDHHDGSGGGSSTQGDGSGGAYEGVEDDGPYKLFLALRPPPPPAETGDRSVGSKSDARRRSKPPDKAANMVTRGRGQAADSDAGCRAAQPQAEPEAVAADSWAIRIPQPEPEA